MKSWDQAQLSERTASDMRGRGAGLVVHLLKAVLARGVPVRLETAATGLVTEKGAVTGVTVRYDGRDIRIGVRRGVVLATGSYASNPRLARDSKAMPTGNRFSQHDRRRWNADGERDRRRGTANSRFHVPLSRLPRSADLAQ